MTSLHGQTGYPMVLVPSARESFCTRVGHGRYLVGVCKHDGCIMERAVCSV